MKKISRIVLLPLTWALLTLSFYACSSPTSDLYDLASTDDAFVMTGNIESMLENADCVASANGIQLSNPLQRLIGVLSSKDRREIQSILDIKGIDLKHTLMTISAKDDFLFAFLINNHDELKQFINNGAQGRLQLAKDGDTEYYRFDPQTVLFLLTDRGILLHSETNTVDAKYLDKYCSEAKAKPLQDWQRQLLDKGKTLNILATIPAINSFIVEEIGVNMFDSPQIAKYYDVEQLQKGYFAIASSLHELDLDIACSIVDDKGEYMPTNLDADTQPINGSLIKYATAEDYLVAMASIPQSLDWNSFLNEVVDMMGGPGASGIDGMTTSMLSMLLSDLSGTVMLAAGPHALDKIDRLYGWHAVIAAEMKEGKATQYIDLLKTFVENNNQDKLRTAQEYKQYGWTHYNPALLQLQYEDGELSIEIPGEGTVYAKAMDDVFVASLSPISTKGGCRISSSDFRNAMVGVVVDVPKENAFSTVFKFPFGCNVSYMADFHSVKLHAKQTDTQGLFLNNLFELMAGEAN